MQISMVGQFSYIRLLIQTTIFLACSCLLNSQNLKGKVYDSKSVVKDMKVINKSQNRLTITDKDGNFNIVAKVNDTISFQSIFYHSFEIIVNQTYFNQDNVFEVKKITNVLDEVEIEAEPEQPVFTEETYNSNLQNLIKEDMKRNPHLYMPEEAYYGGNILAIIDLVVKLFKRKNKYKAPSYSPATYQQLDSLFSKSKFFKKSLLTDNLNIPADKAKLFLDFCSAKGISSEFLLEEKQMELLEELVVNSELFLILLKEYGSEEATKD